MTRLAIALGVTLIAFYLTMAAAPRSQFLLVAKLFLAAAFAWLVVEGIRAAPTGE